MTDAENTAPAPVATPAVAAPGRGIAVDTPVAKPVAKRDIITRRVFLAGGFWSTMGLALVGMLGAPLDFLWPRGGGGTFGGPIPVTPDRIPAEGDDPIRIVEGRFWLVNMEPGETPSGVDTPGGLLALWQKCPHLGCTVPYNQGFNLQGVKGWFRCPCHGSTYTKRGGVILAGPAPRPLDVFPIEVNDDLSITVQTGRQFEFTGSTQNPARSVVYEPGNVTPEESE